MKSGGLLRSNPAYLIWFAFYFALSLIVVNIFTSTLLSAFLITALLYAISLVTALSPVGEEIIRKKNGLRPPVTSLDQEFLIPLFEEVYTSALKGHKGISRNIRIFIEEKNDLNAYATGRNTLVVTRGAIEGLSVPMLKGVISHELGHFAYGDTKALQLNYIGNGFFSFVLRIIYIIVNWFYGIFSRRVDGEYAVIFTKIIVKIFNGIINAFLGIGEILLMLNSRYSEYLADSFAYRIGYGAELKDALYLLYRLFPDEARGSWGILTSTHPYMTDRIARLERMASIPPNSREGDELARQKVLTNKSQSTAHKEMGIEPYLNNYEDCNDFEVIPAEMPEFMGEIIDEAEFQRLLELEKRE